MKNRTALIVGGIIVFIILIVIIAGSGSSFTVYPVQCNDWINNVPTTADFSNCQKPKALDRQTFSADASKNQITQTSPDSAEVYKLDSCTIQDNQHWSCGDWSKMPGGMLASTKISRSGDNFSELGLTAVIFVTKSQWDSINNGKSSVCGLKWCDE